MSGRGTDPAVLLPPARGATTTIWHGGWLAALCKFLLGFESPLGVHSVPEGGARERETVARLLEDEIAKVAESKPAQRSDFLARYARIIQHYDLVKPNEPLRGGGTEPAVSLGLQQRPKTVPVTKAPLKREPSVPLGADSTRPGPVALTSGGAARGDEPTIGFAELLFRNGGSEPSPPDAPDWARAAASAPPTLPEHLMVREDVPIWLKAAVFLSGSMLVGAMCAHLSGSALWQKRHHSAPVEANAPRQAATAAAPAKPAPVAKKAAPNAVAVEPEVPKAIPVAPPPPVVSAPPNNEVTGGLKLRPPGTASLRDELAAPSATPPVPPRP